MNQAEIRNEIGTDYYDQICKARGYETKEQYEEGDSELADIRRVREAMKSLKTFSVDKAIASLDNEGGNASQPKSSGKKTSAGNGGAIAKGQQAAQQVGSALTQAAKESKKTNKLTNLKVGARQAELDKSDQQLGYLHRMAQLETAGAQVFGDQLTNFNNSVRADVDAEVDIEEVLGGLDVAAPLGELGEEEDFSRVAIPIGITFFA